MEFCNTSLAHVYEESVLHFHRLYRVYVGLIAVLGFTCRYKSGVRGQCVEWSPRVQRGPDGKGFVGNSKAVQSRMALYHGVRALHIDFTNDAEETFCNALRILQVSFSFHLRMLASCRVFVHSIWIDVLIRTLFRPFNFHECGHWALILGTSSGRSS